MNADKALELARKAYPNNEELRVAYMLGLNEGYELYKEQMMKGAVEGEVIKLGETDLSIYIELKEINQVLQHLGVDGGDRVKLIVIKED